MNHLHNLKIADLKEILVLGEKDCSVHKSRFFYHLFLGCDIVSRINQRRPIAFGHFYTGLVDRGPLLIPTYKTWLKVSHLKDFIRFWSGMKSVQIKNDRIV